MPHDETKALVLFNILALWAIVHVSIAATLARREPRWRGAVALVVPPLGLYWAILEGMRVRAALWALALALGVVARVFFAG